MKGGGVMANLQGRVTTKKRRKRSWRSGTSKSHPKKHPEWREAKRRVGFEWVGTLDLWCFLAVPFTHYFLRKEWTIAERRPRPRPHPHRHLKTVPA